MRLKFFFRSLKQDGFIFLRINAWQTLLETTIWIRFRSRYLIWIRILLITVSRLRFQPNGLTNILFQTYNIKKINIERNLHASVNRKSLVGLQIKFYSHDLPVLNHLLRRTRNRSSSEPSPPPYSRTNSHRTFDHY